MRKALLIVIMTSSIGFAQKATVYSIGDSTMENTQNAKENPSRGWGQVLQQYFTNEITVKNRAFSGRSSRSYINENRWDSVYRILKPGDYVLIQFGHNDQKENDPNRYTNAHTAYRHNLIRFVNETREKGAIPILLSSIVRRSFNEHGTLMGSLGDYPLETRLVAKEFNVEFIDLQYLTEVLLENYGPEKSKTLFLHFKPNENPYYPEGKEDNTHLSIEGANAIATIVVKEIKKMKIPLANQVK